MRRIRTAVHNLQGFLCFLSIIVSPWLFGCVHDWSITVVGSLGIVVGLCQAILVFSTGKTSGFGCSRIVRWLFIFSTAVVLFVFLHAFNARAHLVQFSQTFTYYESFLPWLPHSYDAPLTWFASWKFLSLFCFFWGVRGWILHNSGRSRGRPKTKTDRGESEEALRKRQEGRRNLLILAICLNGGILSLVGILQRLSGTDKLLWIRETLFRVDPEAMFGPFAYRGNACAFLNLLLPLGVGFYFSLRKAALTSVSIQRAGNSPRMLLIPLVALIFCGSIFVGSRGGFIVLLLLLAGFFAILLRRVKRKREVVYTLVFGLGLSVASYFFLGDTLEKRFTQSFGQSLEFKLEGRLDIYQHAAQLIAEFQPWGSGPGTFSSVYLVYRQNRISGKSGGNLVVWSSWAHSDPVEFLVTFGWMGSVLLIGCLILLLSVPLLQFRNSPLPSHVVGIYFSLFGMVLHSFIDFPFQIYSLALCFVFLSSILVSARPESAWIVSSQAKSD